MDSEVIDETLDKPQVERDAEYGRASKVREINLATNEGGLYRVNIGGFVQVNGHTYQLRPLGNGDYEAARVNELFVQFTEDDYYCANCGATTRGDSDIIEEDSFPSHGGTVEGWERCKRCKTTISWCDMTAVM